MVINKIQDYDFFGLDYLTSVRFYSEGSYGDETVLDEIVWVELVFSNGILSLRVNGDDDTIVLSVDQLGDDTNRRSLIRRDFPEIEERILSKTIFWVWELCNHQGYIDGIQIEFTDKEKKCENNAVLQFIAIASKIEIYFLNCIVS